MLNTPAAVAQGLPGPLNVTAPQAAAPQGADERQAFAQALDRATARQRDASSEAAEPKERETRQPRADSAAAQRPEATDAKPAAAARAATARKAAPDLAQATPAPASEWATTPADAGVQQATDSSKEPARPDHGDAPPPDLAAWVSSLPLPRPAAAAAAAAATAAAASAATAAATPPGAAAQERAAAATALRHDTAAGPDPDREQHGAPGTAAFASLVSAATLQQAGARPARGVPQAADEPSGKSRQPVSDADPAVQGLAATSEPAAVPRSGNDAALASPALPAGWGTALPRIAEAGTVPQAELRAPVGSGEFAPALGSMLSVMVRDGVEHAQLKLNPADMGPIDVRISLDGTQAQVDFSAANAATRQALQEAVPALASALRESGLTLSGGGVFEQPREQREGTRQDGARQRGDHAGGAAESAAGSASPARMPRARGVVDLYA
jgi:flagellar hook-length control protein FliK